MNEYNNIEIRSNDERFFEKLITHPKIIEAYEERKKAQRDMVNGNTINPSESGKLDSIMLYGGGRGGGMSYILHKKYVMEDYPLTLPEKKGTITSFIVQPSSLLVKLIGRIVE